MDLNKLRYFAVTARFEHVTKAAQQLNMTQPALTRALHKLEDELGLKLFVRDGRNIRLTAEGARLRDEIAPSIAQLEHAEDSLRDLRARSARTIRLCIQAASVLAVDAVAAFSADHPDAAFEVTQDESGPHDVFVGSRQAPAHVTSACFDERIGLAAPVSFCQDVAAPVAFEQLEGRNFVSLANTRWLRRLCDARCAAHGFVPHITYESENPSVVRKMIALCQGVGFWPERSWGEVDSEEVHWLSLADEKMARSICVELTPDGFEKPLAREFHAFLVSEFETRWGG